MKPLASPAITVVQSSDLAGLEPVWRRLLAQDPCATLFQTWEWNAAWWRHFGGARRPLFLIASGPDGPLALAPLAVRRVAGAFRAAELLGTGVSDYLGPIGPSETMPCCLDAFVAVLAAQPGWDLVDLQQLHPEQAERCGLPRASGDLAGSPPQGARHWSQQAICPIVELPDDWDEFLGRLGKKMRYNVGYYERVMRRDHELSLETASAGEVGAALEEFFELHARRWRRRWLPGALYTRALRDFHRDVAPALHSAGLLRLHRLRLDGRTAAALYCFHYGARALYYLGGFEPELARYSTGTVLTAYAVRCALAEGCTLFDFLRGLEPYKRRWPVRDRVNRRLQITRPGSARSRLALRLTALQQHLQDRAQDVLHHAFARR